MQRPCAFGGEGDDTAHVALVSRRRTPDVRLSEKLNFEFIAFSARLVKLEDSDICRDTDLVDQGFA